METIWLLVLGGLFAGWFALDGFSLGVGMLLPYLGGRPDHRRTAVTAFGPFFLANEVWLLAAVTVLTAAFPRLEADLFAACYPLLVTILIAWITRDAAVWLRSRRGGDGWRSGWDAVLTISSTVVAATWGLLLANVAQGLPTGGGAKPWWALFDGGALLSGCAVALLVALHSAAFLAVRATGDVADRARRVARSLALPAAGLLAAATLAVTVLGSAVPRPMWTLGILLAGIAAAALAGRLTATGQTRAAFAATLGGVVGPLGSTRRRLAREIPPLRHAGRVNMAVAVVSAALLLAQADLLAAVLTAGVAHRAPPAALAVPLAMLAGVAAARAALGWGRDVLAQRRASRAKAVLRQRLLACAMRRGPVWRGGQRAGELVTLAGRGLDGLDGYVAGYLPQLALAAVVPGAVLVRLALADWPSAVIIALTVPLLPLFAVLAGRQTRTAATRQYQVLVRLGGHFLDVITGLPTLLAFNRETPQIGEVGRIAHAHRRTTLRTLRAAFLSALALELVATLSVALVAVPLGLRLLAGHVDLYTALLVLLLAPEAYLPVRALGARFHASVEGLAAARQAFALLDDVPPGAPAITRARPAPDPRTAEILLEGVRVHYPGRSSPALTDVTLLVRPGETVAVVGPTGAGKSTLLHLMLGLVTPTAGRVLIGPPGARVDLREVDLADWWRGLAWVPQRPALFAATVADNVRLGLPAVPRSRVRHAVETAGASGFVGALADDLDT